MTPLFSGEMQLAGWSESHTGGCKVTFWLSSPDELAAFRTLTVRKGNTAGQRFMAALVEIGDDELPVQPVADMGIPITGKPKGGPLSIEAAAMCRNPEYLKWIDLQTEQTAAEAMRHRLHIESRSQLDHDAQAAVDFVRLYRGPFLKYLTARGKT